MSAPIEHLLKAEQRGQDGETNVWLTPRWVLEAVGPFDLDPCGHRGWDTAGKHFYESDDGLAHKWSGMVWCNPPYGTHTARWVGKWAEHGNGFLLTANRSDSGWWQAAARAADAIWFPRGRIQFMRGDLEKGNGPAFASSLFAIGDEAKARIFEIEHPGILVKDHAHIIETQGQLFSEEE